MSKTKIFLFTVTVAAMLTACGEVGPSDDYTPGSSGSSPDSSSSNSNGACYAQNIVPGSDVSMCAAYKNGDTMTAGFCAHVTIDSGYELQHRSSCPPNHKLRCEKEELYFYYYGNTVTQQNFTCQMLLGGD